MAYKNSGAIGKDEEYQLGEYTFTLQRVYSPEEGTTTIQAHAEGPDGQTAAKGIDIEGNVNFDKYRIEANGDTADVYCDIIVGEKGTATDSSFPDISVPFSSQASYSSGGHQLTAQGAVFINTPSGIWACSRYPTTCTAQAWVYPGVIRTHEVNVSIRMDDRYGHPFYFAAGIGAVYDKVYSPDPISGTTDTLLAAYIALYGYAEDLEIETEEVLIARFEIDVVDAGGAGEGSDWEEPIDYNEDPYKVLHLTVMGALSGRHNDPLHDTSYSYAPADKATVKDYGCGGDGGDGGGGGAGASTVVVYKFATSKANSKDITTIAKRHGYGSGGGKGGKGGEGCILIYY